MTTPPQRSRRTPRQVHAALLIAITFHGSLLLAGSYRRTFDAYVHLFFADHYRRWWFSSWDTRWYTGFRIVSYPPGSHQLLAAASHLVGLDDAFPLVALTAILLNTVGIYRFSCIWVTQRAAGYAAVLFTISSSIAETLHVFGQLPTLLSLSMLLNSLPFAYRWIRFGRITDAIAGLSCAAATTAVHHVTTLFGSVFFLGPVALLALVECLRTPLPGESTYHSRLLMRGQLWPLAARRLRRVVPATVRAGAYGGFLLCALIGVVLPYWLWSASDPITQMPIPHASRDSFIANPNAGLVFFVIPWGVLIFLLPFALVRGVLSRAWPLAASIGLLFLLGTGGTTPLPRMLLGEAFNVLTLDRFTFWGTIAVLPLAGRLTESAFHGRLGAFLRQQLGASLAYGLLGIASAGFALVAIFSANLARYRPLQPAAIAPGPIVSFLDKDQHMRWRFLTLGFGDQMAWLSAQTLAESVDGNYHSARRLPELTTTPVERLEGAKYTGVAGLGSLQQFLANPEKFHLKFVFSNDHFYDPLLTSSGWQALEPLQNGIAVWQHEDVSPLPAERPHPELPMWQRVMWGTVPMTVISCAWTVLLITLVGPTRRWPAGTARMVRRLTPGIGRLLWAPLDRRLERAQQRIATTDDATRWAVWMDLLQRLRDRLLRPATRRRRSIQAGAVVVMLLSGLVVAVARGTSATPLDPLETVLAYYDRLDLRKPDEAYALLNPNSRPTYAQYVTERSVVNGLVASYGRMQRAEHTSVEQKGDHARVRGQLVFLTALSDERIALDESLTRVDGVWTLEPRQPDLVIPPGQLVVRPVVDYLSQGRRQVSAGRTAYADVVDRPAVAIPSARLVMHGGQLSVVGEVTDIDSDPAYLTMLATLYGPSGETLARYTGAVGAVHTALPGETVPFRVDFEGVAGADGTPRVMPFEAGARTALRIDAKEISRVEVRAMALVTSDGLGRGLAAERVRLDAAGRLRMGVRNNGLDEITIPHVFVTLRDEKGEVGWVDDVVLPDAVRPQRVVEADLRLTDRSQVQTLDVRVDRFANSISAGSARPVVPPLLGGSAGWAAADLTFTGFTRLVG